MPIETHTLPQVPDLSDREFLLIGGLHRSGTSILHRLLREHPDTTGFSGTGVPEDEGQHLQSVFRPARDHGGPGRFAFDPAAQLSASSPLISDDSRKRLSAEWGQHYDLDKRLLLEKSPPNLIRAPFFQAMFPRTCFVFIVRHPAAVSLATQKWSKTSLAELLLHWHTAHKILIRDLPQLRSYVVIRYEDLIADKDQTLARICDLSSLTPFTPRESVLNENDKYFSSWSGAAAPIIKHIETIYSDVMTLASCAGYRFIEPFVVPLDGSSVFANGQPAMRPEPQLHVQRRIARSLGK